MLNSGTRHKFLLDYTQLWITSVSIWLIPSICVDNPKLDRTINMLKVVIVIT